MRFKGERPESSVISCYGMMLLVPRAPPRVFLRKMTELRFELQYMPLEEAVARLKSWYFSEKLADAVMFLLWLRAAEIDALGSHGTFSAAASASEDNPNIGNVPEACGRCRLFLGAIMRSIMSQCPGEMYRAEAKARCGKTTMTALVCTTEFEPSGDPRE